MGEDLEFTEEEMFSHLDRRHDETKAGKENSMPSNINALDKPKADKLKRQRSNIPETPETHEAEISSSQDDEASRRKSMEASHPVTTHFKDSGAMSQSVMINRGIPPRHRRSMDQDESDRNMSRLGTSMPITIPGMERAMSGKLNADKNDDEAGKFVPPHLLDQDDIDSRVHSVNSGSLSSGSMAKRDRLLQRNKIFRRTGFLEGGAVEQGKAGSGALPELMDPLTRRLMPIKESFVEPSALSAALGTPQKSTLGQA